MCKERQKKGASSEAKVNQNNEHDSVFSCKATVKGFVSLRKEDAQSRRHSVLCYLGSKRRNNNKTTTKTA